MRRARTRTHQDTSTTGRNDINERGPTAQIMCNHIAYPPCVLAHVRMPGRPLPGDAKPPYLLLVASHQVLVSHGEGSLLLRVFGLVSLGLHCFLRLSSAGLIVVLIPCVTRKRKKKPSNTPGPTQTVVRFGYGYLIVYTYIYKQQSTTEAAHNRETQCGAGNTHC